MTGPFQKAFLNWAFRACTIKMINQIFIVRLCSFMPVIFGPHYSHWNYIFRNKCIKAELHKITSYVTILIFTINLVFLDIYKGKKGSIY